MSAGFSVLILVRNEEIDLPGCLCSVDISDDVVVYDSFSTDFTKQIALHAGARFIVRPGQDPSLAFGGDEGLHRTWGIHEISYRYPWLFVIDADERLTPAAAAELQAIACSSDSLYVAYRIRRRDFFQDRHLKHVQTSPWYIRFFRPEFVHYERLVNTVTLVNGPIGDLAYPLDHYPFSKGLSHWIARHNSYSSYEAQQILQNRTSGEAFSLRSVFFEHDFNRRRFHQKELFYRLPARPLIKFVLLYLFKGGFLDGRPGFTYALLQSIYEAMIVLKVQELERDSSSPRT
ncbi:glycosyltransferase family 2 protein [Synechococcus sp. CS-1325]|uniref:glycosyltransferase family 2 protein n=1 Tax=unclassified Synechococcus TaxID=2626047 RepID=UPI0021A3F42C|nr:MULTISPECIES: glycosyltransferase family 2 protein [unclassified Synechococcus]MCT0200802.1 glycosyltransferase family 2 protein [Synechococcus sp. CS-1325]MCT0213841.1 glycosyltransferase family 2 protein [Synechococcus sp. CS-1326]MCT0233417.1 glycosyltransferase family 2 protein [Synechococcus sp. CS-1327]